MPETTGVVLRILMFSLLLIGSVRLWADEETELISRCADFEAARVSGDVQAAKALLLPDALWIADGDSKTTSLLAEIQTRAKRSEGTKTEEAEFFVAERIVEVYDRGAVVIELLRVASSAPKPPRRRSLFWLREGDAWKLAHVHTSTYLRWDREIRAFESQDAESPPMSGGVVFVGSSSIRRWDDLASDFPNRNVLNRGFGGSQMVDCVLFATRIVTPYKPRAVVVYEGDNDIGNGKSADQVLTGFQKLVESIHMEVPEARIGFLAIKPSLKRLSLWPEMQRANEMVQRVASENPRVDFLDIATPMLGADGKPLEGLFASDGLHLNDHGYEVWKNVIKPWLDTVDTEAAVATASEQAER